MKNTCSAIFLGLVVSGPCLGQDEYSWAGIWQDERNPGSFFTIHENGDEVVLVVLTHVDTYGDALKAAYTGKKSSAYLEKISQSPDDIFNRVVLDIRSPTEGVVFPYTYLNPVVTRLRKVF